MNILLSLLGVNYSESQIDWNIVSAHTYIHFLKYAKMLKKLKKIILDSSRIFKFYYNKLRSNNN